MFDLLVRVLTTNNRSSEHVGAGNKDRTTLTARYCVINFSKATTYLRTFCFMVLSERLLDELHFLRVSLSCWRASFRLS